MNHVCCEACPEKFRKIDEVSKLLSDQKQQIVQFHAALIHNVAMACHNRALLPQLEPMLEMSAKNGWATLVAVIRQVINGKRDASVLLGLDEEDRTIIETILCGIQDPSTLPDPNAKPDASLAAPGLAAMTEYLHDKTALLPRIRIRDVRSAVGKTTEEAMLVGAVHGYRGLIRGLLGELRRELNARRLPVVATGGYAALIASGLPEITAVDPLLTLEGLRLVWGASQTAPAGPRRKRPRQIVESGHSLGQSART